MAAEKIGIGEEIELQGRVYRFVALNGTVAVLSAADAGPVAVQVSELFADPTFKHSHPGPARRAVAESAVFEALAPEVRERARWLEEQITEVVDGLPASAGPGTRPRPGYDPVLRTLRQREQAKHAELAAAGETLSFRSFQRLRAGYQQRGITALLDQRLVRRTPLAGQVDPRVVEMLLRVLEENTGRSSGTMERLFREVDQRIGAEYGSGRSLSPRCRPSGGW
jgi:putative transposase